MMMRIGVGIFLAALAMLGSGCGKQMSEDEKRIKAAADSVQCDSARHNVLLMLNAAGGSEDAIRMIADEVEKGTFQSIKGSKLEAQVARELFKHRKAWESIPVEQTVAFGAYVSDTAKRDEAAWKIGKEVCMKQLN